MGGTTGQEGRFQLVRGEVYMYSVIYYKPTSHFRQRYIKRMSKASSCRFARRRYMQASKNELAKRANYMLLFSIHGRPGDTPHTEVRYYFKWDIIIDNKDKKLVTMYINEKRSVPPTKLFGDRRKRKMVYDIWFKPNSKYAQQAALTV